MKQRTFFLLAVLVLLAVCLPNFSAAQSSGPLRLKVLCYNIRFGELASLEELAAFIDEQDPDLVALQEVDCRNRRPLTPRQNGKDFATELGFRTGMLAAYGKTIPYAGGWYGIAILSKYPLARVERVYLPMGPTGREQRAVLVAEVEVEEGRYITFASTHLDTPGTEERQAQVARLNEVLLPSPWPVIVAGDFNAAPESVEISEGMRAWQMFGDHRPTSPAHAPRATIDYIFAYPEARWRLLEARTIPSALSDHLPVGAVVELR